MGTTQTYHTSTSPIVRRMSSPTSCVPSSPSGAIIPVQEVCIVDNDSDSEDECALSVAPESVSKRIPASTLPKSLFSLVHTNEIHCTGTTEFPVRYAHTAEEYLVDLLLTEDMDNDWFKMFLDGVVLNHVFDVNLASITVTGFNVDTASVLFVDCNPSRKPVPPIQRRKVLEPTTDVYVVPVARILAAVTTGRGAWSLEQTVVQSACPALPSQGILPAPLKKRKWED